MAATSKLKHIFDQSSNSTEPLPAWRTNYAQSTINRVLVLSICLSMHRWRRSTSPPMLSSCWCHAPQISQLLVHVPHPCLNQRDNGMFNDQKHFAVCQCTFRLSPLNVNQTWTRFVQSTYTSHQRDLSCRILSCQRFILLRDSLNQKWVSARPILRVDMDAPSHISFLMNKCLRDWFRILSNK